MSLLFIKLYIKNKRKAVMFSLLHPSFTPLPKQRYGISFHKSPLITMLEDPAHRLGWI